MRISRFFMCYCDTIIIIIKIQFYYQYLMCKIINNKKLYQTNYSDFGVNFQIGSEAGPNLSLHILQRFVLLNAVRLD
jgi:hypothetical protein